MKKVIFLSLFFFFSSSFSVFANSSYVLPYPSTMPGRFFYKIHQAIEKIEQYWYFGNFGQFTYNLEKSDKYLVEAKTLFEYKQYLLGYQALEKSNTYFEQTPTYLERAEKEGKDISEKRALLTQAAKKHREVLGKMRKETPARFIWVAEKSLPVSLDIYPLIEKSSSIRFKSL